MNKILSTKNAPAAIGPYSQGVQAGNTVYVSGQLYFVPETGELLEGTIGEMTEQCMKNIAAILAEADCALADIVKTTIFLKDLNDFAAVNEAYGRVRVCRWRSCRGMRRWRLRRLRSKANRLWERQLPV